MMRGLGFTLVLVLATLTAMGGAGCRRAAAPRVALATDTTGATAFDSTDAIYSASKVPIPELGYNAREGHALYRHYCLNCHGEEGRGDGFNAYNLDPKPQSLADSTFQAQHTDADIATAIHSGGGAVGLSTGMPPWGRTLDERQIQNLVAYLRTLADAN